MERKQTFIYLEEAQRIQMKEGSSRSTPSKQKSQDQATTGKREKTHKLDEVTLRFKSPSVCEVLI